MAASSEQSRHAQSVMSFMELCADIRPSLRKTISNSNAFRTFVLDLAQEGSAKNVAIFDEAHRKCAAAWKLVLETRKAEKKRKAQELEGFVNPSKRTKLSCATDKDIREPLKVEGQTTSRASPSIDEHSTSHAAENNIPSFPSNSDSSLFVPWKITPVIQGPFSRASTPEDEAYVSTPDSCSDTETQYASSDSSESDTITQDAQPLAAMHEEESYTSSHSGMIENVARGPETTGSTSTTKFSTAAGNEVTLETAESMGHAASFPSAANAQLVTTAVSLMSNLELRNTKEVGITLGSPTIVAPIKVHCLSWHEWSGHQHRKRNIDDILNVCTRFNFDIVKHKLLLHLEGRPPPIGSAMSAIPVPSIWDMSEAFDIVNALQIISINDKHGKIQRAYAQMKLFTLVEAKATAALVMSGAGKNVSEHLVILEELAKEKASNVLMQDSIERRYTAAYFAGKRWKDLVSWFGGAGSVLIFVTIGIGNSYVEYKWNDFQRACFEYITRDLFSIKKLVRRMGDDVLEQYCRYGNLTPDLTNEIKGVEGYC